MCLNIPEIAYAIKISASSVKKARDELARKGFIRWESQGGNRAAKYYVLSRTGSPYAGQSSDKEKTN